MVYDDALATRVRKALSGRSDVVEKAMFGGISFMVAGNLCCGVNRGDLVLRLDRKTSTEDLGSVHVRPWDFMKKPMPGMFVVNGADCASQKLVEGWVKRALEHALSLPHKNEAVPRKSSTSMRKAR